MSDGNMSELIVQRGKLVDKLIDVVAYREYTEPLMTAIKEIDIVIEREQHNEPTT